MPQHLHAFDAMSISPAGKTLDPVIISSRVFDAPRNIVFDAFASPDLLSRWWGPSGFTNTFEEFDFQPGGVWRFTMHAPNGDNIPIVKHFLEIVPPESIVLLHEQGTHTFRMTMLLSEGPEGTRLTWHMQFEVPEEAERVRPHVEQANEQNFDRLAALLTQAPNP